MIENLYTPNCIRTFTGKNVNVIDPDPETICIEDIAHALSFQCRFGGHLPSFYTVAQHSCYCARGVAHELRLDALLHDASEAYLLDIPSPVKSQLTNYKEMEDNLMLAIADKFGFAYPLDPEVKKIDKELMEWEWKHIMLQQPSFLMCSIWDPEKAQLYFLEKYNQYSNTKLKLAQSI